MQELETQYYVFIWVPKLLGLYPSLDFEQEKSILLFPLVSWSFCSIFFWLLQQILAFRWTQWVPFQSYWHTVHCSQFFCTVSIKTLRSTSIFWEMLVLPSNFKIPIIQYSFSEFLQAFPSRNHHMLSSAWQIISSPAQPFSHYSSFFFNVKHILFTGC